MRFRGVLFVVAETIVIRILCGGLNIVSIPFSTFVLRQFGGHNVRITKRPPFRDRHDQVEIKGLRAKQQNRQTLNIKQLTSSSFFHSIVFSTACSLKKYFSIQKE